MRAGDDAKIVVRADASLHFVDVVEVPHEDALRIETSAWLRASSGDRASFTPPAFPRPPAWICAFTAQMPPPSWRAAPSASKPLTAR